jgi:hypothetical protein
MYFQIQCFPLYSLLLAVGNPVVDYLSLDTEGTELDVSLLSGWKGLAIGNKDNWKNIKNNIKN